jgi:hypothetical protein
VPEVFRMPRQWISISATVLRDAAEALRTTEPLQLQTSTAVQQFVTAFAAFFVKPTSSSSSSWFVKLEGSDTSSFLSPWDWALHDRCVGIPLLKSVVPLPSNGMPTPLERDRYLEALLDAMNRTSNRFELPADADEQSIKDLGLRMLRALAASPKTFAAISNATPSANNNNSNAPQFRIVIEPWVRIPTVLNESVLMFREGKLRSVLQRRGNVRYCSRDDGKQLAQRLLEDHLRAAAAAISAQITKTFGTEDERSKTSVAVRCVCVPQRHSLQTPPSQGAATAGVVVSVDDDRTQAVKVLVTSIAAYGQEADNSAIFLEFDPVVDAELTSKPIFNFTKHFTYRLFNRDVLQVLAQE